MQHDSAHGMRTHIVMTKPADQFVQHSKQKHLQDIQIGKMETKTICDYVDALISTWTPVLLVKITGQDQVCIHANYII